MKLYTDLEAKQIKFTPGWSICCNYLEITASHEGTEEDEQNYTTQVDEYFELDEQSQIVKHREGLYKSLEAIGMSPIKTYSQSKYW